MKRLSLRLKTMIGTAIIEAVLLSALIFVVIDFMMESANDAMNKRATTTASLFASATKDAVLSYDLATLDAFTNELLSNPDILYVKVIDGENQTLSFAGNERLKERTFEGDTLVETVTDGIFDIHADIVEGGTLFGTIQIGIDIGTINRAMSEVKRWTVSIALFEMALVAIFSYFLGIYLTTNLYILKNQAKFIARNVKNGVFDFKWKPIQSKDELQELSLAFDELSQTLAEEHERRERYKHDLIELNKHLEELVAQRTEKLNQKNQQLEATNRELEAAQQQLVHSEKMASVGQLAAGVAHEINNPLGFVMSNLDVMRHYHGDYAELAKRAIQLGLEPSTLVAFNQFIQDKDFAFINSDCTELIDESMTGLQRVSAIVNDLKQFSRADTIQLQPCDINACIKTTLNLVESKLKYHANVITQLNEVPQVLGNQGKLIQVLTNLLINAAQALKSEGEIRVSTSLEQQRVLIRIQDDGVGIPEEIKDKIFDPFFTTKPIGNGTGLGLSISYDIIKEHGGELVVESEVGIGSCFTITLPVSP
ncbi:MULTISPECIES: sensor histidine kinase [Pseudoalteromonas]|uniref:sensor histidine kinase n=1 Tax=Pseudoalteromonas TaxID=53246 RepID=UPI00029ACC80|nr:MULTISPECIES: ATP-binding protein [Pseudoalteromonas]MCF2826645.1 ATP-binding protein [Pseudoalteromonas sp. OF5H-5]MCF2830681.1 ATP-binding protein [Pseudoalteromonas sp. DL2-H6]MCF2926121.1 ATP-binding protein [Pseudoalteromonas sp. DL2-H1]